MHIIVDGSHVLEWQCIFRRSLLWLLGHGRGPLELNCFGTELSRLISVICVKCSGFILIRRVWDLLNLHIKAAVLIVLPLLVRFVVVLVLRPLIKLIDDCCVSFVLNPGLEVSHDVLMAQTAQVGDLSTDALVLL